MSTVTRRQFLETAAATSLWRTYQCFAADAGWPVRFRRSNPYEALARYIEPGQDDFAIEAQAADIRTKLDRMIKTRSVPTAPHFQGVSPCPVRHKTVGAGIVEAEFNLDDHQFNEGLRKWIESLGRIRRANFAVLAHGRVRYEIASAAADGLEYRVGL